MYYLEFIMATEIERKFLIDQNHSIVEKMLLTFPLHIIQGYLTTEQSTVVRFRIQNDKALLTIKGKNNSLSRLEYEYPIPINDAYELISLHKGIIFKQRYLVPYEHDKSLCWEVDVFQGLLSGLIVAEIEIPSEDYNIILPEWIKQEVSQDNRYFNSNLCHMVFDDESCELRPTQ